jgi:hypothetical protein
MNERHGPNEPTTEITIDYTFFKKIYIVSNKHILDQDQNVSKYFTHVQIDIVDLFDNNNNTSDNGGDKCMFLEYIDAFDTKNIKMDVDVDVDMNVDVDMDMDEILLETSFMDADEEDSASVKTVTTIIEDAGADVDANSFVGETRSMTQSKKKYVKGTHVKKRRKNECYEKKNNENIKKIYNTDNAPPVPTTTATTPPKSLLNLNKIKNVIQNEKVETRNNNVKVVPIEKKLLLIMKKITTKIESELTKEIINYKLILNNFKKSDNFQTKINAFYYTLLNKIDNSL